MMRTHARIAVSAKPLLLVAAIMFMPAATQVAQPTEEHVQFDVTVTTPRAQILVCEPFVLDIAIRNAGASAVEIDELYSPSSPLFIHLRGPDGKQIRFGPTVSVYRGVRTLTLRAGAVYTHREILLYGMLYGSHGRKEAGYPFSTPGEYVLTLTYAPRYPKQPTFEAGALKVTVLESSGRERRALELFRGRKQAWFVEWSQGNVPEEFRRLAVEYPDTVYGRYARFYLAATVIEHRFDWAEARREFASELAGLDRGKAERRLLEKVFEKAASEFAHLARGEPAFPLADQCLLYLAECYLKRYVNRRAEAVKVLKDLVAKYPESPVAVKAKKRLEKLGKKPPPPTTRPSSP